MKERTKKNKIKNKNSPANSIAILPPPNRILCWYYISVFHTG